MTINVVTILGAIVGLVAGFLLGINGFTEPTKSTNWKSSARLKNLGWLLTGLVATMLTDFNKFGVKETISSIDVLAAYVTGAIVGLTTAILWMTISIWRSVKRWNSARSPDLHLDPETFMRDYITYGKTHFDEKWEAATNTLAEREHAMQRRRDTETNKILGQCVYGVLSHLNQPAAKRRNETGQWIEVILNAVCVIARSHCRKPNEVRIEASYMAFIAAAIANEPLQKRAVFAFEPADHYTGYLELRHGSGLAVGNQMVLPVDGRAGSEGKVLPGAPEAVAALGVAIMNVGKIDFRDEIPKAVREEVTTFFKRAWFSSITSLVLYDGQKVHGVINIESSEKDLLGDSIEAAVTVCATLQPLAALLSGVVSDAGG
jgi:hypothetical protein